MTEWNLADCLDAVADFRGARPALIQGEEEISWRGFRQRAASIAAWLNAARIEAGAKVALYTYNHIAYLETAYACMQVGLVPVNINYRYQKQELRYLLQDADVEAMLVHEDFAPLIAELLPELPGLKAVIQITDTLPPRTFGAIESSTYDAVVTRNARVDNTRRSSDDTVFIYTGGTTGMPKGVMWRQGDLYFSLAGGTGPAPETAEAFHAFILADAAPLRALVLPPLMHATAFFAALTVLLAGGTVILTTGKRFDPAEALTLIERRSPNALSIVGDVFAQPLLEALARQPYDVSSLESIHSSGALWSNGVKSRLIECLPDVSLFDALGSTEAHNIGASVTTEANVGNAQSSFTFGPNTILVDETKRPLARIPGTRGMIAVRGRHPIGYYKDQEKSESTLFEIDDDIYTLSGDWAMVNEDSETFTLLGRGSICINTGGEKVYPEEVEGVIKQFEGVKDTLVVGVPSETWGETVTAVVLLAYGAFNSQALKAFVSDRLAGYKVPRHIIKVEEVFRSPSGKADYPRTRQLVMERLKESGQQ